MATPVRRTRSRQSPSRMRFLSASDLRVLAGIFSLGLTAGIAIDNPADAFAFAQQVLHLLVS